MSFLNPVNEPVLRFSSTDTGAPQINYNARTAGDVKAVLKACLVTGYGATASAGWTAVNEAANVIEFVSPSAAMSDYRIGISDAAANTTWYYQYRNVMTSPTYNKPAKVFTHINKSSPSNGWQLLVTDRGLIFIEMVLSSAINEVSCRVTYMSIIKSALLSDDDVSIAFFNVGHAAQITETKYFYDGRSYYRVAGFSAIRPFDALPRPDAFDYGIGISEVDITSRLYIQGSSAFLGELPALLAVASAKSVGMYGVSETTVDGRPALRFCAGMDESASVYLYNRGRVFLAYLDYWEY